MELIKIYETTTYDNELPEAISKAVGMYSRYRIEYENLSMNRIKQSFFVPEDEYEYYQKIQKMILDELSVNDENAVLKANIARRYGLNELKHQKRIEDGNVTINEKRKEYGLKKIKDNVADIKLVQLKEVD